jgi:hypothetical protein
MNIGMAGCTHCRWGVAQVIYTRLDVGFVDLGSMVPSYLSCPFLNTPQVVAAAALEQHSDL